MKKTILFFLFSFTIVSYSQYWNNVGYIGFTPGTASFTSFVMKGTTPCAAYTDFNNYSRATVIKYVGNSWVTVGSPGFSAGEADYISLTTKDTTL
ncbi:MAG: hypothetical protein M1495_08420, partial [Bacteroidetes bacterium]|nr:hypothetical protein [Bacteroidota bacterium]